MWNIWVMWRLSCVVKEVTFHYRVFLNIHILHHLITFHHIFIHLSSRCYHQGWFRCFKKWIILKRNWFNSFKASESLVSGITKANYQYKNSVHEPTYRKTKCEQSPRKNKSWWLTGSIGGPKQTISQCWMCERGIYCVAWLPECVTGNRAEQQWCGRVSMWVQQRQKQ